MLARERVPAGAAVRREGAARGAGAATGSAGAAVRREGVAGVAAGATGAPRAAVLDLVRRAGAASGSSSRCHTVPRSN